MQPAQFPSPNPNSIPPALAPSASQYYPTSPYPYYYYYPPNPHPDATQPATSTALVPPVVDPTGYPPGSLFYFDPNQSAQNSAAVEAIRQFGSGPGGLVGAYGVAAPSSGTEQLPTSHLTSTALTNSIVHAYESNALKKQQKKTKVVQSAYCEVCKVDCNSKEVLNQHTLGKKHKKNLEKLRPQSQQQAISISSTLSGSGTLVTGPQEDPTKGLTADGRESKKKAADTLEDLERKRRKVLESGAAAEAVKTCSICNIVCNSETVFKYHLAGQKHIAAVKRLGVVLTTQL